MRPPFRGVNRFSTVTLLAEPRLAAVPAGHALAARATIEPSELMGETWAWVGSSDRVAESFWLLEDHRYGRPAADRRTAAQLGGPAQPGRRRRGDRDRPGIDRRRARSRGAGVRFPAVEGIDPSPLVLAWRPSEETPAVRELADVARVMSQRTPLR